MAFTPFTEQDMPTMENFNSKFQSAIDDAVQKAVASGVKIQTGSYTGTGTYGSSNPCSLTFDFVPKFVFIFPQSYNHYFGFFIGHLLTQSYVAKSYYYGIGYNGAVFSGGGYARMQGRTLSWYMKENGYTITNEQLNSTIPYFYIAVG